MYYLVVILVSLAVGFALGRVGRAKRAAAEQRAQATAAEKYNAVKQAIEEEAKRALGEVDLKLAITLRRIAAKL